MAPGGQHAEQCTRYNQRYLVSLPTSGAEPNIVPGGEASLWLQVENTQNNVQGTISDILCPSLPLVPTLILSREERRVFGSRWRTRITMYKVQSAISSVPTSGASLILSREERQVFGSRWSTCRTMYKVQSAISCNPPYLWCQA